VHQLHERLNNLALSWLSQQGDGIPVQPEVLIRLGDVNWDFWNDLVRLEPFGAGHAQPLFWCRDCQIVESRLLKGRHLSITLLQEQEQRRAIAWRWPTHQPVPERCDVAFQIGVNRWQGENRLQLDVKAMRQHSTSVVLQRGQQNYVAHRLGSSGLKLRNRDGEELEAQLMSDGQLTCKDAKGNHPQVRQLLEEACLGLGLRP
jgi:single-stranded-DNA-specific exonuclease